MEKIVIVLKKIYFIRYKRLWKQAYFKEYRITPQKSDFKSKNNFLKYIICGNVENIMRLKETKNLFIDDISFYSSVFYDKLKIMNKDIIAGLKIPAL